VRVRPAEAQTPITKKGVIHSSGTSVLGADDKTAVAAILSMVDKVQNTPHRSFELLITVREETDAGIRDFKRSKLKSKTCILSDISLPIGTIVTAAPYVLGYSVEVEAPGSHVGRIVKDTVHPLTFLKSFMKLVPYGRLRTDTIVNIAIVKMGESYNSVPQKLHFTGEIRTFSKTQYEAFVSKLKRTVPLLDAELGTTSTLTLYPYCTGYVLKNADIKETISVMKSLKITPQTQQVFSVGDFNILYEMGITAINIGNGALEVHTTRERVAIRDLELLARTFKKHVTI
jgi:tripeptide aminopeptidase